LFTSGVGLFFVGEDMSNGNLSSNDILKLINKKAGRTIAFTGDQENPADVKDWISTGSRWLDSITCRGQLAGVPVGRCTEIAGLESSGKSYMAGQIAREAQKKDIKVLYFDSESTMSREFLEKLGCIVEGENSVIIIQPDDIEQVLESMETVMSGDPDTRFLFILDSLAMTPCRADLEKDFNPQSSMAQMPRVLSLGMKKLVVSLSRTQSTLLVLNQLKTNINVSNPMMMLSQPWFTPGGKAMIYAYSLRIWLTGLRSKKTFVEDEAGFRIGSEVKAKLEKSKFGTQGRICNFKILWGGEDVGILNDESLLTAIKSSDKLKNSGAWFTLDGYDKKFQTATFPKLMQTDEQFAKLVYDIMDEEVIRKFETKTGNSEDFYGDEEVNAE
jgi:recombination protein RecA